MSAATTAEFDGIRTGDRFAASCTITRGELDAYLGFARVKNEFLDEGARGGRHIIPGRALLARIEGEFTRLPAILGRQIILVGSDGDPGWGGRSARFLAPFYAGDVLHVRYVVSDAADMDGLHGRIAVDYEASDENGSPVLVSRRNIYRISKRGAGSSRR